jgi:hypothetical protein
VLVFSDEAAEPLSYQRKVWVRLLRQTGISDLRWHDLRHEYASRLVERGVPLSQVRDLLGHASTTTTERYDNQEPEALLAAARRLETGGSFKIPSTPPSDGQSSAEPADTENGPKLLQELEEEGGVGNGVRTRDFRSHSPALCH